MARWGPKETDKEETVIEETVDQRRLNHPGVLATKVGYFGVKSAKVLLEQMGT